MEIDRNGLEVLDRDECLRLLAGASLGRVGFTSGALPTVLPVDFRLDGDRVLVRARRGSRLGRALRDAVVAFEVDDVAPDGHAGWSVAVTGLATEVHEPTDTLGRSGPVGPVERWASTPDDTLVTISTEVLTGRRIIAG